MEDLKEKFFRIYYSKIDEEDDYKKLDYIYYSILIYIIKSVII